jgi:hypothetical protein
MLGSALLAALLAAGGCEGEGEGEGAGGPGEAIGVGRADTAPASSSPSARGQPSAHSSVE